MPAIRLGILLSGSGTTLQNIADVIARGELPATIAMVISSNPKAFGITRAEKLGLPVRVIARKDFVSPADYSEAIATPFRDAHVDLVCMAGFLSLWPIPKDFVGRVMNIHPALLPKFGGLGMHGRRVHEAVLAAGETESGCTVHWATDAYDDGPIILQRRCPVLPGDTPDTLAARVFAEECVAYPAAIRQYVAQRESAWRDNIL
jgi:phosphoribosylglycinamide formyltransferase-1